MIKQGLEIKQTQKMSPLQILTIKLIELPVQSLEQKVRSEIEENPVLDDGPDPDRPDESKDISIDELKDDDYIPAYKTRVNNWGKDARPEYNTFSVKESFNQKLMDQLGCRNLDKHQYDIDRLSPRIKHKAEQQQNQIAPFSRRQKIENQNCR